MDLLVLGPLNSERDQQIALRDIQKHLNTLISLADSGEFIDTSVSWTEVLDKPLTFAPSPHEHNDIYYTKAQVDGLIGVAPSWARISGKPSTIAGYGITDVYTKTEVDGLLGALAFTSLDGQIAYSQLPSTGGTWAVGGDLALTGGNFAAAGRGTFGILSAPAGALSVVVRTNWITATPILADATTQRGGFMCIGYGAGGSFTSMSYGGTSASPGVVTPSGSLGAFIFGGWDGASWALGASVICFASETWSTTGHGSSYSFRTVAIGSSAAPSAVMTVGPGGKVDVGGTLSVGINFGIASGAKSYFDGTSFTGDTYRTESSSNQLDDYVGAVNTLRQIPGSVVLGVPVTLKSYAVGSLPIPTQGMLAYATDLLTPTFGATAVGGGAVKLPVFYDGTNWVVA